MVHLEKDERVDKERGDGEVKKSWYQIWPFSAATPLSFLCLYHYLKDSHHVYHLYRSAQLRALSVGTKAESPTIPAYVSTKSKPAVTALIIVISSS